MSLAHLLIDGCMGFVCLIWLCQFLTEHSRYRNMRRNAWTEHKHRIIDLTKRQAD